MKVLIGIPNYEGKLSVDLVQWLENIMMPEGYTYNKIYITRTPIHMARNIILERMIAGGYDYVIMMDDDQLPTSRDCFYRLLTAEKDMVSGVVRLRRKKENLNILKSEIYTEQDKYGMVKYVPYKELPNKGLFKIDNAGTGLVCLSRKVCEHMIKRYVNEPFESKQIVYVKQEDGTWSEFGFHKKEVAVGTDGKPNLCRRVLSEDYLFFERAISNGFELWCQGQSQCFHFGDPEKICV